MDQRARGGKGPDVQEPDVQMCTRVWSSCSCWLQLFSCLRPDWQYRLKIPHSAGRKTGHHAEKMVYSFSRLVENRTGW